MTDERDKVVMWFEAECKRRGVGVMELLDQFVADSQAPGDDAPTGGETETAGQHGTFRKDSGSVSDTPPVGGPSRDDLWEELKATHDGEIRGLRKANPDYVHVADGCPTCDLVARYEATRGDVSADEPCEVCGVSPAKPVIGGKLCGLHRDEFALWLDRREQRRHADTHEHGEKREHRGMKNPYEFDPDAPAYAHAEGRLVKAQGWSMQTDVALRVAADIAAAAWEAAGRPEVTFGGAPEVKRTMLIRALQMRLREAQLRVEDKDHWSKRTPADSATVGQEGVQE